MNTAVCPICRQKVRIIGCVCLAHIDKSLNLNGDDFLGRSCPMSGQLIGAT